MLLNSKFRLQLKLGALAQYVALSHVQTVLLSVNAILAIETIPIGVA
jgi:hypothetical protein